VQGVSLVINAPNGVKHYDSNRVLFNLSSDIKGSFFYNNINGSGTWIKICDTINKCIKNIRLDDGANLISIKFDDGRGNMNISNISVNIDSKKPRVLGIFPRGALTNGSLFSVKYSEENLKSIALYYANGSTTNFINNATACMSGINQECNFSINFPSGLNGKWIDFWFSLSDSANTINSSKTKIKVDNAAPNIVSFAYAPDGANGRRIKFIFDVFDDNFKDIIFKDSNDCGMLLAPSGKLCSNLHNGRCIAVKTFCAGYHYLDITASDKAGNTKNIAANFTVITES
jgi:hypothetical protein